MGTVNCVALREPWIGCYPTGQAQLGHDMRKLSLTLTVLTSCFSDGIHTSDASLTQLGYMLAQIFRPGAVCSLERLR